MDTTDVYSVDVAACRGRQQRLTSKMDKLGLELMVLTRTESVQWLTGAFLGPLWSAAAAIDVSGHVTLALPLQKLALSVAADEIVPFDGKLSSTFRDDQQAACYSALLAALPRTSRRAGGEWSCLGPQLLAALGEPVIDVEPFVLRLRRRKDPDELRMLARANEANRAMYEAAREIVRPGLSELDLYSELQSVAVRALGEPLTYFGQDFQCNSEGGPPRNRPMQAGELLILDLGVGFRGYYSDDARTLVVGAEPTRAQHDAWLAVREVFPLVESRIHPGASCRQLFDDVQALLDRRRPWVFNHHLGHGLGLAPHEGPHLNPRWDDRFEVGNVVAVEPGLYHEDLRHGVRLEQNYLVVEGGVEQLTDSPLDL